MANMEPVLGYSFAKDRGVVLMEQGERVLLGVLGKPSASTLLEARRAFGVPITVETLPASVFHRHLSDLYSLDDFDTPDFARDKDADNLDDLIDGIPQTADLLDAEDHAPIIRLINGLIARAAKQSASDIHVEPFEKNLSVRFRIDGVLREVLSLSHRLSPPLVSRIKVMARLDIAEKRIPQDGRISLTIGSKTLDVRVSTLPSRHGERVVLRLLDKDQAHFSVNDLGMSGATLEGFRAALREPNGVILVTGPTGSGKTTTLYAGLNLLNDQTRNILTVEDPIEYALEGVGQTQVNPKVGMSFAAGLRAILRQDPDIVMVGEIRDGETAEVAVQASLTGHLVLSTVHTNDAISAITRLRDMGIEAFLLASTTKAILAQRLVRRLCVSCKEGYLPDAKIAAALGLSRESSDLIFRPKGCTHCNFTGYLGRVGIYELIRMTDALRALIHENASEDQMRTLAFADAETLAQSGYREVVAGTTSLEEVLRVCRSEGNGGI